MAGSGGGTDFRPEVRQAVKDFNSGLLNISKSVPVQVGVISFNALSHLDFPLQDMSDQLLQDMNRWVDGAESPSGTKGYFNDSLTGNGWTNWRNALKLALDTYPNQGQVDVYVWFTDGRPETSVALAPPNCDNDCFDQSNAYFSDICSGNHTCVTAAPGLELSPTSGSERPKGAWAASYYADQLKQTGAKLFMVAVGNILPSEDVAQLVTGKNRWNGTKTSFATSDYLISTDLTQLGANLTAVLEGLCPNGPNVGAIVGGVIAGIIVAAVVAALIIAFLSWKGYSYYTAQSGMSAAGATNNAVYNDKGDAGEMPDL